MHDAPGDHRYVTTIFTAFCRQACTQSEQEAQKDTLDWGISYGFSCVRTFRLQEAAAAQIPPEQRAGRHFSKFTRAVLPGMSIPPGEGRPSSAGSTPNGR